MDELTTQELQEKQIVDDAFQHLVDSYLASKHRKKVEIITKAFNFARQAHKGVRRLSGEPYIMHPIAVAQIVCSEIGLGSTSICAALLHDVVEDTDYTVEDLSNIFGPKIAQIVDGLTKISGGIFGDHASAQAETFRKLLLTMSDDIRVILIKIADRLHNMRTLGSQKPGKQYKIAGETLYLYAPLANRLGLNKIKEELEDLSFRYEHPEEYAAITKKLADTKAHRDIVFNEFIRPIQVRLDAMGLDYEIKARVKAPYSIWSKMQNKHVTFEEIYDILAVRIIFKPQAIEKEVNECFDIYVALTKIYKPHPDRFRDWLSRPKANGYQALHVTLMSNKGQWIEVQIRSERMNDMAEQGFAAHWKYKEGDKDTSASENELERWLHTIKEILDDPQPDAMDFLDAIKLNLFATEIFVFTPKGEIRTMPQNCTALDFAFSIHTFLGTHCIGAKVNHKLVPLSYKLQSGDQVEILTSKQQHVQAEWLDFATTAKSKGKIQAILRREQRSMQKDGEDLLQEFFQKEEVPLSSVQVDRLCQLHNCKNREDLCIALGTHQITLGEDDRNSIHSRTRRSTLQRLLSWGRSSTSTQEAEEEKQKRQQEQNKKIDKKKTLILSDGNITQYHMATCCHPIPGDDILGFLDHEGRITIHKRHCSVADRLKTGFGNGIIAAKWDTNKSIYFDATIQVKGIDRRGVLSQMTTILSDQLSVNIRRLNVETKDGIFECTIRLQVFDTEGVNQIIHNFKEIPEIEEVTRIG